MPPPGPGNDPLKKFPRILLTPIEYKSEKFNKERRGEEKKILTLSPHQNCP